MYDNEYRMKSIRKLVFEIFFRAITTKDYTHDEIMRLYKQNISIANSVKSAGYPDYFFGLKGLHIAIFHKNNTLKGKYCIISKYKNKWYLRKSKEL